MGWGFIFKAATLIGAAGAAIAVYDWLTRPSAKQLVNDAAAAARAGVANSLTGAQPNPRAPNATRAQQCDLRAGDWAIADQWTAEVLHLGHALDLVPRLKLAVGIVPMFNWPTAARRVYCTYIGG